MPAGAREQNQEGVGGTISQNTQLASALRGRWLLFARVTWVMVALATLGAFAISIPARYAELSQPTPGERTALAEAGISPGGYALYDVALDAIFVSVFAAVASPSSGSTPTTP